MAKLSHAGALELSRPEPHRPPIGRIENRRQRGCGDGLLAQGQFVVRALHASSIRHRESATLELGAARASVMTELRTTLRTPQQQEFHPDSARGNRNPVAERTPGGDQAEQAGPHRQSPYEGAARPHQVEPPNGGQDYLPFNYGLVSSSAVATMMMTAATTPSPQPMSEARTFLDFASCL